MKEKLLLLVEDNPLLIGMYETAFAKAGYIVSIAHDGNTGITLANELRPSNILLDLLMPGTDGFAVIRALKENPETKDIGIVVLTSDTKQEDLNLAKQLGATQCLQKSKLTLAEIVEQSIQSFQQ